MGDPTSSNTAAGTAFEFNGAHKPPLPATKCFQYGGDTIEEVIFTLQHTLKHNKRYLYFFLGWYSQFL
jgi:hypothetical protein